MDLGPLYAGFSGLVHLIFTAILAARSTIISILQMKKLRPREKLSDLPHARYVVGKFSQDLNPDILGSDSKVLSAELDYH